MVSRLNPYLNFSGNAREAMEFYQGVFGGTLTVTTFAEFGQADTPIADKIMHARLETPEGYTLMGADAMPDQPVTAGTDITLSLSGDASEGGMLRDYWTKLADGGTVTTPLEKQMWGDEYGECTDKFGIRWMVDIGLEES